MRKSIRIVIFSLAILLIVACSSYSEADLEAFDATIKAYLTEQNLQFDRLENGLYYHIIEEGSHSEDFIQWNNRVTFTYEGSFLSGEVFQATTEHSPLTFLVRELIVGWQDGLSLIKSDGEIDLIIPPQLAYGDKNTDLIPPNTILRYRLKVLEVE